MRRPFLRQRGVVVPLAALLILDGLVLLPTGVMLSYVASIALACLLPGWLLVGWVCDGERDPVETACLALGLGFAWMIAWGLLLHYAPGRLSRSLTMGVLTAATLALIGLRPPSEDRRLAPSTLRPDWVLLGILALAALLRLVHLAYAEFQGDEVAVLHKVAAAIQGREDVLFLHKKGPAEILVPAVSYALTRRVGEGVARLPFALASLGGLGALYAVGRRMFGECAGRWAALLIALNGFFVAFGCIVQYQSLVFLFGALAAWCAFRFVASRERWALWLCSLFLACGLLAHYDAAFAALPCAYLIARSLASERQEPGKAARSLAGPLALAAALLALFYLPFALHPYFRVTQGYLQTRGGAGAPYQNLRRLLDLATVYNSVYYLLPFAAAVGVGCLARLRRAHGSWWLWIALALLAIGALWPAAWHPLGRDPSGVAFSLAALVVLVRADADVNWRATYLWCAVPFVALAFWFREPRTHIHAAFLGASLLLGWELDRLQGRLSRGAKQALLAGVGVLLAVSTLYLYVVFVGHTPEYKRTYPDNKLPFFWTPYGDEMPTQGLFGFPYRAGWKAVGLLYASGALQGDYWSNEETHIIGWYSRGAWECDSQPRYLFIAEDVQDVQRVPPHGPGTEYGLFGQVWVGGAVKLRLYERESVTLPYREYRVEQVAAAFDHKLTDPHYP
ncbi:MAG: glycosyltransferase family 39 protein, partial [Chloroflexi bacterium]|nr:glycosyltransferase family 39 protein [Chloroflexota bacterium]